jgi:hypothetical protein
MRARFMTKGYPRHYPEAIVASATMTMMEQLLSRWVRVAAGRKVDDVPLADNLLDKMFTIEKFLQVQIVGLEQGR